MSIEDLVAEFIERRERGELQSVDSFVAEYPDGGEELRDALRRLEEAEGLFPERPGDLPERIGDYRVLGEIGRGGMGRVLRVEHVELPGEPRALKLLNPVSEVSGRHLERFRREAEALSGIEHPGIVRVFEFGVASGSSYLVMELVEGESLAERLAAAREHGALDLPGAGDEAQRAARMIAALARAVAAAHAAGVLHRDIKPHNVLLRSDGSPVLADFGLVHRPDEPTLTQTGDVLGTPQYMSPEQARGERLDERADVFGLGAVLYELLTLAPPRPGTDSWSVLSAARSRPVEALRRRDAAVTGELRPVLYRALAFARDHRYASAAELADDLEAFSDGGPVRARSASPGERVAELWMVRSREILIAAVAVPAAALLLVLSPLAGDAGGDLELAEGVRAALTAWVDEDEAGAAESAAALLAIAPDDPTALFLADWCAGEVPESSADAALQRLIEAEAALREEGFDAARPLFKEAEKLAPEALLPKLLLGLAAFDAGETFQATTALSAAVIELPESSVIHGRLAGALYESERFVDAEIHYEAAVRLAPEDKDAWMRLSKTRYHLNDYEGGVAAAERAVELAAVEDDWDRARYGALLDAVGRPEEAQRILRATLERVPDSPKTSFFLAHSLDRDHRVAEARDQYQHALDLDPNFVDALMCLAWICSGNAGEGCEPCTAEYERHPELEDHAAAVEYVLRALRIDRGVGDRVVPTIVLMGGRMEDVTPVVELLEELKDEAEENFEQIGRLEWALRKLR